MNDVILYNVFGYPDLEKFKELCLILDKNEIEILEIGIPSRNPFLEGNVIADAQKIVSNKYNSEDLVGLLEWIREQTNLKIVLMTYYDGFKEFNIQDISLNLYDAILCVDHDLTELPHIPKVQIYSNQDSLSTIQNKLKNNKLFCYVQSSGQTGTKAESLESLEPLIKILKQETTLPIHIGFGIKNEKDIEQAKEIGADGVIIGTQFIRQINEDTKQLTQIQSYLLSLKE